MKDPLNSTMHETPDEKIIRYTKKVFWNFDELVLECTKIVLEFGFQGCRPRMVSKDGFQGVGLIGIIWWVVILCFSVLEY